MEARVVRYIKQLGSWVYRRTLLPIKKMGIEVRTNSKFLPGVYLRNTEFEGRNFLGKRVSVIDSKVGYGTMINQDSSIVNARIGRYTSLAPNVRLIVGQHPTEQFVSSHSAFCSASEHLGYTYCKETHFQEEKFPEGESQYNFVIGNDVWIATEARILEGVVIGDGAIIGACSLVTKNVEPYSINVGIPAKRIGYRFSEEQIVELLKIKWWEHDEDWMREHVADFEDIDSFVKKYQNMD